MKEINKNNENSFVSRNKLNKNKKSNIEQDNDDIIKKLSQITPSEDRSFESSVVLKNLPKFYDTNHFSKDSNITPFIYNKETYNENECDENKTLINNNKSLLNQKLKYLCSLIQISNINLKKYDDLKQFNNYLSNDNLILKHYEPINVLFDIISEFIFYIQKEFKNSDLLMKEMKRLKYNKNDIERQIYKLKLTIKEKDKEINALKAKKNDEYYQYNLNEINELKQENKELYKKINTYKTQMKKVESSNKVILNKLKSFNTEKNKLNTNITLNSLNSRKKNDLNNLYSLSKLNNSYEDKNSHLTNNNLNSHNTNFNILSNYNYKTINYDDYYSPLKKTNYKISNYKTINHNNINNTYNNTSSNNTIENNDNYNNKNNNGGSLISNMKLLLKDINNMLKVYNSTLDKIKIGNFIKNNNTNEKKNNNDKDKIDNDYNNMKYLNEILNKMNSTIKKLENNLKAHNEKRITHPNTNSEKKKLIQVNTSRWKFTKKSHKRNSIEKNNINKNSSESSLNNTNIFHKKIQNNLTESNLCGELSARSNENTHRD